MQKALEAVLMRHVQAENAHDMEATLATLHPECVFHDFATGQAFRGREGARAHYRQWWDAFGVVVERDERSRRYWTTDGSYLAEVSYRGVHRGEFFGVKPSGREVRWPFLVVVEFREELLSAERFYYDLGTILRQIGAPTHAPFEALAA